MIRLSVDKIASATKNVPLRKEVRYSPAVIAQEGYLVAGRIVGEKSTYNVLENPAGRMMPLHEGDVVVGVLGRRNALHGYSGVVPEAVMPGDRLHVLNMGGVVGHCTSVNPDVGEPFGFEVIGGVLSFPDIGSRQGVPAHVSQGALSPTDVGALPPVIFIAGTCMNSGKTLAACQVVRALGGRGVRVGGCKLTGISLLRDTLSMQDYGAEWAVSFVDAGVVTTDPVSAPRTARTLLHHLAAAGADVIVAELGDGLLGQYGVQEILADTTLMCHAAAVVLCANDPVGAWGGELLLRERFSLTANVISGPTTDNLAGAAYIESALGVRAINARSQPTELGDHLHGLLAA